VIHYQQHEKLLEAGVILTVEEGKIRTRLLPIQREKTGKLRNKNE
jgi:hypothetical protein